MPPHCGFCYHRSPQCHQILNDNFVLEMTKVWRSTCSGPSQHSVYQAFSIDELIRSLWQPDRRTLQLTYTEDAFWSLHSLVAKLAFVWTLCGTRQLIFLSGSEVPSVLVPSHMSLLTWLPYFLIFIICNPSHLLYVSAKSILALTPN